MFAHAKKHDISVVYDYIKFFVYFFCLKLEELKRLFLLSDIPQPLDITLKAFQTK